MERYGPGCCSRRWQAVARSPPPHCFAIDAAARQPVRNAAPKLNPSCGVTHTQAVEGCRCPQHLAALHTELETGADSSLRAATSLQNPRRHARWVWKIAKANKNAAFYMPCFGAGMWPSRAHGAKHVLVFLNIPCRRNLVMKPTSIWRNMFCNSCKGFASNTVSPTARAHATQ